MTIVQIEDQHDAEVWLQDKPEYMSSAFASRCATRALTALISEENGAWEELSFAAFRSMLCANVWSVDSSGPLAFRASAATDELREIILTLDGKDAPGRPSGTDIWVGYAVLAATESIMANPLNSETILALTNSVAIVDDEIPEFLNATSNDATILDSSTDVTVLWKAPIWHQSKVPSEWNENRIVFLSALENRGPQWSFWRDWYQGFLDGKPLDWELQRRVALIPDVDWEKGPTHIAEVIEEIRKRFELEQRIEELEQARDQVAATKARLGIGGNNPPEPIEGHDIQREVTVVWGAIEELKAETAKDIPDKSAVARIIAALSRGMAAILVWCGRKGDLAVDTLIKWGIPVGAATLLAKPDLLKAVVDAAKAWLGVL